MLANNAETDESAGKMKQYERGDDNRLGGMIRSGRLGRTVSVVAATMMIALGTLPQSASAQGFGRNRIQYDSFRWQLLNTPHFAFHYYEGTEEAVHDAARIAERSYAYLSQALQVEFEDRIPVLLYADHQDFRQTNATMTPSEGTQGVTESLKQRLIMPMMPSMQEFTHVFTHELVHVFQFEMLGAGNSLNPIQWAPPLWMMEGMAEYYAIGMDHNTEIWLRDLVRDDEYLTLGQMETVLDQRVYRLGQSLYYYLADVYGQESVRRFFKQTVRRSDWRGAMMEVYSQSPKELSEGWQRWLKASYESLVARQVEADSIATRVISHEGMIYNLNLTPSISPDGKRIAYVANRNLRDGVYIANAETGKSIQALAHGGASGSLESVDLFESTMSWSRDGRILSFVSSGGAEDVIHLLEVESRETIAQLRYDGMSIISAAVNADGSQVVFSGMKNGQRDLYVAATDGSEPRHLTSDIQAYLHPAWSPDGRHVAVTTDRGAPTDVEKLDFRGYRLALIDVASGEIEVLTGGGYVDINPVWSPDGTEIAFISNRHTVPQVYLYDLEQKTMRRVTDVATGVSGITTTSPAISWSSETGTLAFSSFREMGWDIYTMPDPRELTGFERGTPTAALAASFVPVWEGYDLGNEATFEERGYRSKISADYVFGAGGFATGVGLLGDVVIGFSDMLGNQNITLQLGLVGSLERSNIAATYINMARRANWGVSVFQQAMAVGGFYDTFSGGTYLNQIYRGASLMGFYPLNTFNRLEGSVDFINIREEYLSVNYYGGVRDAETLGSYTFGQAMTAWVHDSALYTMNGPIGGQRWRLQLSRTVGQWDALTTLVDFRKYVPVNRRGTLAWRTMAGGLFADTGEGYPFRVGGPTTVHGTDYGQMYGSNLVIQNLEFRYPLLPWLPLQWDFLQGAVFADAGAVWEPGFTAEWLAPDDPLLSGSAQSVIFNSIVGAVGAGVRANLGYFTIFVDYAWPTDSKRFGNGRIQFTIGQVF
jgi:hypothetical protein